MEMGFFSGKSEKFQGNLENAKMLGKSRGIFVAMADFSADHVKMVTCSCIKICPPPPPKKIVLSKLRLGWL